MPAANPEFETGTPLQGTCAAAIMSEDSMSFGFGGYSNEWDCGELDAEELTGFVGEGFFATAESGVFFCLFCSILFYYMILSNEVYGCSRGVMSMCASERELCVQASVSASTRTYTSIECEDYMRISRITAACVKNEADQPLATRDCDKFRKVGDILASISLAMPVAPRHTKAVSYFVRQSQSSGQMEKWMQAFDDSLPQSTCATARRRSALKTSSAHQKRSRGRRKGGGASSGGAASASMGDAIGTIDQQAGLPWTSMVGVLVVSIFVQILSIVLWAVEHSTGKSFSKLTGFEGKASERECVLEQKDTAEECREQATEERLWISTNQSSQQDRARRSPTEPTCEITPVFNLKADLGSAVTSDALMAQPCVDARRGETAPDLPMEEGARNEDADTVNLNGTDKTNTFCAEVVGQSFGLSCEADEDAACARCVGMGAMEAQLQNALLDGTTSTRDQLHQVQNCLRSVRILACACWAHAFACTRIRGRARPP